MPVPFSFISYCKIVSIGFFFIILLLIYLGIQLCKANTRNCWKLTFSRITNKDRKWQLGLQPGTKSSYSNLWYLGHATSLNCEAIPMPMPGVGANDLVVDRPRPRDLGYSSNILASRQFSTPVVDGFPCAIKIYLKPRWHWRSPSGRRELAAN
jgi:hypothetical protein